MACCTFHDRPRYGCTDFQVVIQDNIDNRYKNLANSGSNKYRYLAPAVDAGNSLKVSHIHLLRSSDAISSLPAVTVASHGTSTRAEVVDICI